MLECLRKNNPKHFFKFFTKKKNKSVISTLSNSDFYTYFRNLAYASDHTVNESVHGHNVDGVENVSANTGNVELDREIRCNDMENAIRKLKLKKAALKII
jgi:hypothetical protein